MPEKFKSCARDPPVDVHGPFVIVDVPLNRSTNLRVMSARKGMVTKWR